MNLNPWILALAILSGQLLRFPVGIGAVNALDIFVITLLVLNLHKVRFKKIPIAVKAGFIFAGITIISLLLTPLNLNGQEKILSFSYSLRFLSYLLFAWIVNINFSILFASGVGVAFLGLLQFLILPDLKFIAPLGWDPHYFRTVSTFLDPNFAGAFFVLTLLLLIQKLDFRKSFKLYPILVYLALLTTFSRSSYGMFLIIFTVFSILKKSWKMQIISTLLFAFLMLGFYIYTLAVSQPRNIDRGQSATSRINTWQQGFEIFKQSPLFGVGFNAYRYALREYNLSNEQFLKSHGSSGNDSSLLFVLSTTGIVGLLAYGYFLFSLVKFGSNMAVIVPAMCGLLFHSIFANSLFFPPILLWLLIAAVPRK